MKKLIYLLLLTPIIYLVSCSSGKGNLTPEPVTVEETIVGVTWQLLNIGGGWFRLNDDYTYSTKDDLCDNFTIKGTWSLKGDIISNRYFIGAAEIVERNTIIEYSDSLLKFQADTTPTADVYIWFEACVPEPIRGCMDPTFLNFNPNAQCPDTCTIATVYGCMDVDALNYDVTANIDDGSCIYPLAIGDTYQGGIIFYLDGSGGGLITTPSDQSEWEKWGCIGTNIPGADGTAIGTGNQNTIDIEAGCTTQSTAADICANLTLGGYSDWFLPSKNELNEMFLNIGQGNALGLGNIGGFANNFYWSSTEGVNYNSSWGQIFNNGFQIQSTKNNFNFVRAVRAF